ncbi:MAG: PilZ domain-containing protein [Rhodocyclaceae bacterium]|nr:PilZ domain-containing protein [Rhodocyclaceae bacterium]
MSDNNERRQRQRIMVEQLGRADFRLECDGQPCVVRDVSLEGFSMHAATPPDAHGPFAFRLEYAQSAAAVTGQARVVNYISGDSGLSGVAGCCIVSLDEDGAVQLAEWLSEHVEAVAAVPLTRAEALEIIAGPSRV